MQKNKYRILHTIESSMTGGAETILAYLASELSPERFKSSGLLVHRAWLDRKLDELHIPYVVIPNEHSFDPGFVWKIIRLVKHEKIDLIHAHEFTMIVYGSVIARLTGIPMVGTIHGKNYYVERRRRLLFFRTALALSSTVVAVSDDLQAFLSGHLGVKNHPKLITLHNGIDLHKYDRLAPSGRLREELGLSTEDIVALSVGSLFEVKGFIHLVEAAGIMLERLPNFHLVIAGEGDQTALREQAARLGISSRIHLTGFRDDVPDLLNMADLYVCSSLSEGLSLSILEAMAVGKPIVATAVGGNPELISDETSGYLVRPADPKALAERMLALTKDKALRDRLGQAARERARRHFSLESMVQRYEKLYMRLLS